MKADFLETSLRNFSMIHLYSISQYLSSCIRFHLTSVVFLDNQIAILSFKKPSLNKFGTIRMN